MSGKKTISQITTCLLVLVAFLQAKAQTSVPIIDWQRCYGWKSWYGDEGMRITPINDGNFLTVGKRTLEGYETITASKINTKGELLWETNIFEKRVYTGFRGVDIISTPDGGSLLLGRVNNSPDGQLNINFVSTDVRLIDNNVQTRGYFDILITKLNSKGEKEWSKILGGSNEEIPVRILLTPDNNILLLSYTASNNGDVSNSGKDNSGFNRDIWVVRLNMNGEIQAKQCFGSAGDELPFDMKKTSDGNYVIVGSTTSNDDKFGPTKGGKDVFALKINSSLNQIWKKFYGGGQNDEAKSLVALPNGDIVVGIVSNSMNNDFQAESTNDIPSNFQENVWLFRLNSEGNLQQSKILGGAGRDFVNDIILTRSENLVFIGSTNSNNGHITDRNRIPNKNNDRQDVWVMKLSKNFDVVWQKTLGGSDDDEGNGLVEAENEQIITIGTTKSFNGDVSGNHYNNDDNRDIWLTKLAPNCETEITTSIDRVGTNVEIIVSDQIMSADRISSNSNVRYSAQKNIDLTTGFNIDPGSVLDLDLWGCTNSSAGISNLPIQLKTNNECREGGMKFTFHPFTPDTDLNKYSLSVQNLNPLIEFKFSGNTLITKNNRPDNGNAYYLVTVSREGYKDLIVEGYTSTCDHDNAPIDCPENTNTVILDKDYYNVGDTFTAIWTGQLIPNQALDWYNENVTIISKNDKTMVGIIQSLPAQIQAQPGIFPHDRPCHGAVKVNFRKIE